ncbi:2-dehydropantoate 2-reductase [Sporosarcina sp. ACRSM]|uniref:ketopantoate reductase family protein n=1 Tax=Sporosarcina sp. ACRSM TaxID=2918216 RepID=UPI001EF62BF7|nr:2-dehydropantoate 2-reductase [Sporosarcina sp. ACRSM]MCG7333658.1 2-dehydropantoate 2-reductase [Sporosarcina sp. ACRSM]
MKIGILGVGSLGTIIGALITKGGYNIDLIDVNQEHVDELNQNGAKITGFLNETIPVKAKHPNDLTEKYDVVFLLTKQVYTKDSLASILPFLHEDSVVCTLQNGIPEESVAAIVGENRTVGGVVGFGATWIGPGVSELVTELEVMKKYAFDIGELTGEITERIKTIRAILETVGYCEIITNINGMKWSKLLMNATFSGMSAALGCTFGEVLYNPDAMRSLANIADETIKVARAHQIRLVEMQGKNFEFLELENKDDISRKMEFYKEVWGPHVNTKASMLQDLEKGRKTEIDYINGYVSKKGREKNIPTPFNDLVCTLVNQSEKTKSLPIFEENISKFDSLNNSFMKVIK